MENTGQDKIVEEITNQIIELLETHKAQGYQKEWFDISQGQVFAENPASQRRYTGINQLYLSMQRQKNNFPLNRWMTFKQIKEAGGQLEKGAKGMPVLYVDRVYLDKSTKENITVNIKDQIRKGMGFDNSKVEAIPYLRHYRVFNVGLAKGLSEKYNKTVPVERNEFIPDEKAEGILKDLGVQIHHSDVTQPKYNVSLDTIFLPSRDLFKGQEPFYSVCFHELGHATGHKTRLNRDLRSTNGKYSYAKEEIIAELFSAFLSAHHGFKSQITNNAGYIGSWIKSMKEDSKLIIHTSSQAQKAFDYVVGHDKTIQKGQDNRQILDKYSRPATRGLKEAERER
jgi:antirestriction protein ArdC